MSFSQKASSQAHFVSHAACSRLDRIPFLLPHSTPSLLDPPNRTILCLPRQGLSFCSMVEQSPFTCYEANDPVEVGSTEVTTVLMLRERHALVRRTTLARTSPLLLLCRKWMEDQIWECWLRHLYHRREREASAASIRIHHVHHTLQPVRKDPWRCAHTRESQVEIQMFCMSLLFC